MHKLLLIIFAGLLLTPVASQAQSEPPWNINPYAWSARTVTAEGRVRVTITRPKQKLYLARQQRPVVVLSLNDDDTDYYDELPEFQVGYRRPELVNQSADIELSDEIKIRLMLARKRALEAYYANWS